jgi:hypothetical protein
MRDDEKSKSGSILLCVGIVLFFGSSFVGNMLHAMIGPGAVTALTQIGMLAAGLAMGAIGLMRLISANAKRK